MGYIAIKGARGKTRLTEKPQDWLTGTGQGVDIPSDMPSLVKALRKTLSDTEREHYEERAGIMQYDGGLTRTQAEAEAMRLTLMVRLCLTPENCEIREDSLRCLQCLHSLQGKVRM